MRDKSKYRLAALVAATAVIAAPVAADAQRQAPKEPKRNPPVRNATIVASDNPVVYGYTTTISGRFRGEFNRAPVSLATQAYPFTAPFSEVARVTANQQGEWAAKVRPGINALYRATALTASPLSTGDIFVGVSPRISLSLSDAHPRAGQKVTFSGRVTPARDGRTIDIQRQKGPNTWGTVAKTKLRDAGSARSKYETDVEINGDGRFRIQLRRDAKYMTGYSRPRTIDAN